MLVRSVIERVGSSRIVRLNAGGESGSLRRSATPAPLESSDSLQRRTIHGKFFSFTNRHDFDNDLLLDDPVDDSDAFFSRIELVIAREVETGFMSEMLTEEGRRFEFLELFGNRLFQGAIEAAKVFRCIGRERDAITQDGAL